MKRISIIIAALLLVLSCDKPYEMELPLSVAQRNISLDKDAGSTHVLVYADGDWTASFTEPVSWASLDRLSGHGNGELVFSYAANYGIARQVGIVLTKDSLCDTVYMTQAGPVTLATYKLAASEITLPQIPGTATIGVSSNLYYSTDALTVTAIYTDLTGAKDTVLVDGRSTDDAHWILSVEPKYDSFDFEVDYNLWNKTREVELVIGIDDPTGRPLRSILKVTQSTEKAGLALSAITGTYEAQAQSVTVAATTNNIWAFKQNIITEVSADWVRNVSLTSAGLNFSMDENTSGAMRTAKISVTFISDLGENIKSTYTIVQKANS